MWKNGKTAGYYDFTLKKENHAFILNSSPAFDAYAASIGLSHKSRGQVFLYFPAFIPLFSLFTVFPYNVAAKIMLAMSSVIMILLLKNIIDTEKYPAAPMVFIFFTVFLVFSPAMNWAIKTGQTTPLLLLGTYFSYKLQQKGRSFAAGGLLSVVAWIKFFPALLIIMFLLRRDYKAIISFVLGAFLIGGIGWFLFGTSVLAEYFRVLQAISLGVNTAWVNQSFEAFFMRLHESINVANRNLLIPPTPIINLCSLIAKILLAGSTIAIFKNIYQKGSFSNVELFRFGAFIVMGIMVLLMPLTWVHYYIFFLPLFLWTGSCIMKKQLRAKKIVIVLYLVALTGVFIGCGIVSPIAQLIITSLGSKSGILLIKFLLSSHLFGGVLILVIAYGCAAGCRTNKA